MGSAVAATLYALIVAVLLLGFTASRNIHVTGILVVIGVVSALFVVANASQLKCGSLGFIVAISSIAVHTFALPFFWFGLEDSNSFGFAFYFKSWTNIPWQSPFLYATLAVCIFAVGYDAANRISMTRSARNVRNIETSLDCECHTDSRNDWKNLLGPLGFIAAMVGSVLIIFNYRILGSYAEFLMFSNAQWGSRGAFLLVLGAGVAVASGSRRWRLSSVFLALTASGALAVSGSRTLGMLALGVVFVTWVKTSCKSPRALAFFASLLVGLMLISLVRESRDDRGFASVDLLGGAYELGGSIRPLAELMHLLDTNAWSREDSFTNSLLVWPATHLARLLGGNVATGLNGYGTEILDQQYGLDYRFGMTTVAEIFLNFSPVWAALFVLAAGAGFRCIDGWWPGTSSGGLVTLVAAVPTLYAVRQPLTLVVPHLLYCSIVVLLLVGVAKITSRHLGARRTQTNRPAPSGARSCRSLTRSRPDTAREDFTGLN